MNRVARNALNLLREVKSVTFATVDEGKPACRTVDVMWVDDAGLYFLTARGKAFYKQLRETGVVAVNGMSKDYVAVRLVGEFRVTEDANIVRTILDHNPVITTIYPEGKHDVLEVFHLHRGRGEIFDLSEGRPRRQRFAFGGDTSVPPGFRITDSCTACGACEEACPVDAIEEGDIYRIDETRCLECGRCVDVCPVEAIAPPRGF